MLNRTVVIASTLLLVLTAPIAGVNAKNPKWEPAMKKFAAQDAQTSPPKNAILFTGSSSIVGWKLEKFFPGLPVLNRGFGGSQVEDVIDYFDQVVVPYEPKTIVFYSGDNDLAGGKTTSTVINDVKQFVSMVHERFPDTRIILIPPKASISRWKLFPQMREVAEAEKAMAEANDKILYVDTSAPMLGPDGKPRAELYLGDKLHMTEAGYIVWSDLVRPHLEP